MARAACSPANRRKRRVAGCAALSPAFDEEEMTQIPTTLVHLYKNPDGPFQSISELPHADASRLMDEMTDANTWHTPRFTREKRKEYMNARRRSEERLRCAFVAKGGRPSREHPYYLALETPEVQTFWPAAKCVRVPLVALPPDVVSFTYLDSMVCDALLNDPDCVPANCKQFAGLSCLGQVYRLDELPHLLEEYGFPKGTYVEAQVWADEPLQPYKRTSNKPDARDGL